MLFTGNQTPERPNSNKKIKKPKTIIKVIKKSPSIDVIESGGPMIEEEKK